jgi:hypothetical protein
MSIFSKFRQRVAFWSILLNFVLSSHSSSVGESVTYTVPKDWKTLEKNETDTTGLSLFHIRSDTLRGEIHHTNAYIRYTKVPDTIGLQYADAIVQNRIPTATYILSAAEKENWKTYLFVNNEQNEQYIVLYRIGIHNAICVEFLMSFPHVESIGNTGKKELATLTLNEYLVVDEHMAGIYCSIADLKPLVDQFNTVTSTLKIDGNGDFFASVKFIEPANNAKVYRDSSLHR